MLYFGKLLHHIVVTCTRRLLKAARSGLEIYELDSFISTNRLQVLDRTMKKKLISLSAP